MNGVYFMSFKLTTAILALWLPAVFISVSIVPIIHALLFLAIFFYWKEKHGLDTWKLSTKFLVLFVLIYLVACAANYDSLVDAGKNWSKFKYPLSGFLTLILFKNWLVNAPEKIKLRLISFGLGTVSFACFYGIVITLVRHQERLRGFTGTLRFGYGIAFVLVVLFAAYPYFISLSDKKIKVGFFITSVLSFISLLLASTRGALLGCLCGVVVVGFFSKQRWMRFASYFAGIVAVGFAMIYLFAPVSWDYKLIGTRHRASDGVRFGQWRAAVMAIKEKPVLGHGPANLTPQLDRIKNQNNHQYAWYSGHAHNTFLEVAGGTGLVGLFLYLAWIFSLGYESFKAKGVLRSIGMGTIACFLVEGQFEVMLDANNSTLIFITWAILSSSIKTESKKYVLFSEDNLFGITTTAVVFLALGTFTSVTIQGAYQILFAIPLVYYFCLAKGRHFVLPRSSWWLLGFAAIALLSLLVNWGEVPRPSKNLGRIKYFLFAAFGIFPIGIWLKNVSDNTKRRLMRCLAVGIVVPVLWLIYQKIFLSIPILKPLTETMRYAYGTSVVLLLLIGLVLHKKNFAWVSPTWIYPTIFFGIIGLILINSRGAQAGFLLGIPFVLWFWKRKVAIAIGVIGLVLGSFVTWNYLYGTVEESNIRILSNKNNASDQIRRSQWQAAYIAVKERPLIGWGFSNFHTQLKRIKNQYDLPAKQYDDAHAHNVPLEIAAGTGLLGLVFFLGWFFTWMLETWNAGGMGRALMIPFFMAIMFEAQFEVLLDANNATWISFLYALSLATNKRYQMPFG